MEPSTWQLHHERRSFSGNTPGYSRRTTVLKATAGVSRFIHICAKGQSLDFFQLLSWRFQYKQLANSKKNVTPKLWNRNWSHRNIFLFLSYLLQKCRDDHDDYLVGGFKASEKYEFVNWDDDIPNILIQSCSSHHQPVMFMSMFMFMFLPWTVKLNHHCVIVSQ